MPVDTDTLPGLTPFALPGLTTRRFGRFAFYLPQVGSTNTVLKEAAPRLPSGAVCAAGVQTAGRGRMCRAWICDWSSDVCSSDLGGNGPSRLWPSAAA